uniref:ATP synthase complex subunit 8 n=10 Tax=unclassified Callithrix TaxID=2765885 RepID=A0A7H1R8F4_9PRIM|nr:ATP synthase F0 subunit 8 [Callithrix sp. 8 JM-2020]QNU08794.1 ATP synthase F0 subunit 8 [Callithrix sp. 9 JM-2020]QNU08820.1 ATP synthase F0 subunit 8 [Callithrix sp. 11 JM-2020]QNU08833.1 ATP synthase F0 subunit 8 [Callithrix sp. 12 JM-2020]QNU08846.1 ATP synthase F0 subunit 8 [Callithrix sp. 13 JM-2020]QNU08859.1 ATP synthase F0 subunit 8 [Callithrix sp. 14 JM-2020]QNU08872.1 ATP synthase F0 subunit 8 [Callithrix sp. 15 JM-2020]QNU08885.1 ATP synthase F0 subunit 8 [Callithrix sp. 16 JM
MPQLNISPWPMVILSMIVTLFFITQLKLLNFTFYATPTPKLTKTQKHKSTWELKWTKIYSLPSMSQQS